MFALILITDIDESMSAFWCKFEVSTSEMGHEFLNDDDWLKFDFSVFHNSLGYMWVKIYHILWWTIIFGRYAWEAIANVTLNDPGLFGGYQPSLDILTFFSIKSSYFR